LNFLPECTGFDICDQSGGQEAEEKTYWWQLPWVPPPPDKDPLTEEEIARKAAIKEKQGQRLRDMAAAKRSSKIADLEVEVQGLEQLMQNLDGAENDESFDSILAESGFLSREEIQSTLSKASISLRKAKGEVVQPEKEKVEDPAEKYPLLDIPNSLLTAEQVCPLACGNFLNHFSGSFVPQEKAYSVPNNFLFNTSSGILIRVADMFSDL
jgi:actin-related protein 5